MEVNLFKTIIYGDFKVICRSEIIPKKVMLIIWAYSAQKYLNGPLISGSLLSGYL
jgi:hypothetical protein